jgi:hypothetical protein
MADRDVVTPSMSDAAVRAKTGKSWPEWFLILDAACGTSMTHKEIVVYLAGRHDVPGWWQQMVTVTYEKARGMRALHEMPDGYKVGGSKTVGVPIDRLYAAWVEEADRRAWLADPGLSIRKATPSRSLRISWPDGTDVSVMFWVRGDGKSQVTLEHAKLSDADAAARVKAYWKEQLGRLKETLEG